MRQPVAEVIGSDSRSLTAQCYDLYCSPQLGALVSVGEPKVFAVVQGIRTEPLDPSRPVLARGRDSGSLEEIYRSNPQIERLLTTRFDALIVGHEMDGRLVQLLPPLPPSIHSFVSPCSQDEVVRFTDNLDFYRFLLGSGPPMADEVVVACLRYAANCRPDWEDFIKRAGQAIASEAVGDSVRVAAILRRARI